MQPIDHNRYATASLNGGLFLRRKQSQAKRASGEEAVFRVVPLGVINLGATGRAHFRRVQDGVGNHGFPNYFTGLLLD
jgi:hypothetical protein